MKVAAFLLLIALFVLSRLATLREIRLNGERALEHIEVDEVCARLLLSSSPPLLPRARVSRAASSRARSLALSSSPPRPCLFLVSSSSPTSSRT